MAKLRRQTFSEIVSEVVATPPAPRAGANAIRPGFINGAGEFFNRSGNLLALTSEVTPLEARQLVLEGADVAFEACGCGGAGGCAPAWFDAAEFVGQTRPRFVRGSGSPTWIDLWQSEGAKVVFLHGDVEWGEVVP